MASQNASFPENQTTVQEVSKLIMDKLPGVSGPENKYYFPVSGVTQLIYPDFTSQGEPNSIYYPSYELSNLYAGYAEQGASLASTTSFNPNPVSNGFSNIELQTSGLNNFLLQAYGRMTWGLSQTSETQLSKASTAVSNALAGVAGQVKNQYVNLAGVWTDTGMTDGGKSFMQAAFQGSGTNAAASQITNSLSQMAQIITAWGDDLIIPGTGVWNSYQEAKAEGGSLPEFTSNLSSSLVQGTIDWGKSFLDSWGAGTTNKITKITTRPFSLPWNDKIYEFYKDQISSQAYTTWKQMSGLKLSNAIKLRNATSYLIGLNQLNAQDTTGNPDAIISANANNYLTVPETPGQTAKYAPRLSTTAIKGTQTGNNISFNVFTKEATSETAKVDNKSSVSWDTHAGYSGWFFSASVSNKGNKTTENGWSKFDNTANNMNGTFNWDSISSKQIKRDQSWYLENALNQAWKNIPANSPKFTGGYAFQNSDMAAEMQPGNFYGVSKITYGTPSATVEGSSKQSSKYNTSSFESFQQTTTASAGFGWGPFSIGGSTSYSTSNQKSNKSMKFSASGSGFKVTNNPLDGIEPVEGAGNPAALLAVQVSPLATSAAAAVAPANASSARALDRKSKGNSVSYAEYGDAKISKPIFNLGRSKDLFYGDKKSDIINGNNGNDHLAGIDGHDIIDGGDGSDVIFGGHGKDKLTGGKGRDYFVFNMDHVHKKHSDTVTDFDKRDNLSFTDILPEELRVKAKGDLTSIAMGNKIIATFENASTELIEAAIENAHYYQTMI